MNRLSHHPNAAVLVPAVAAWDDHECLDYLLRYGPHCFDPNQPSDYINGWYDDNRPYTEANFSAALDRLASREQATTRNSRLQSALRFLSRSRSIQAFLTSICKADMFKDETVQTLTSRLAQKLADTHLHHLYRFRMIPSGTILQWQITGLNREGHTHLAWLPTLIRLGNHYDAQLPLPAAIRKAQQLTLLYQPQPPPAIPPPASTDPRQVAKADSRSSSLKEKAWQDPSTPTG